MNHRAALGLPIVLLVLLMTLAAPAHAVTTFVDQRCNAGGGGYLADIGINQPVGQVFTPTETDIVTFSLNIYSTSSKNTSMTAKILSGGIRGDFVASKDFIVPPNFGLATNGDWFNVTFDDGVQVTPGATYAIDLTDNQFSIGVNWNKCSQAYGGGYGYSVGVPLLNEADFEFMEFSGTFIMEVTPATLSVGPGHSGSSIIKITSFGSFDGSVNLTVRDVPSGMTARFDSNSVTPPADGSTNTVVTISVAANMTVGTYPITIFGISGSQHPTSILTVVVSELGDFTISASPTIITVPQGGSSVSTISVGSINGFNSTVSFTGSWLDPTPVGLSFIPPHPETPSPGANATSELYVAGSSNASVGLFKLRIAGTSGSLSHFINVTIQVQVATISSTTLNTSSSKSSPTITPDFSIALPSTITLSQGATATTTVSVTSLSGFESAVSFSYSWMTSAPSGISIDLPGPITPLPGQVARSTLTISASPTSSTGSFTLIVTGTSASLSHTTNAAIIVIATTGTPSGPQCLIATATYGSELSPEVQILRSFRDYSVQKTKAGSSFMLVFNTWYYSFSPYAATYLKTQAASRMIMKGILYPLVGVLLLASNLFTATSTSPELGILLSGLVASGLIGALYIGLPLSLVRMRLRLRREEVATRVLFATLLIAMAGLFAGEVLSSSTMLMLVTPVIVISSMLLSGMLVSKTITSIYAKFSD